MLFSLIVRAAPVRFEKRSLRMNAPGSVSAGQAAEQGDAAVWGDDLRKELAKAAGANEAWAAASQSRDVEFEFRDGALEKVKDTTSRGLTVEVYADDRYSSHQTTDLNPDRLKSFVSEATVSGCRSEAS